MATMIKGTPGMWDGVQSNHVESWPAAEQIAFGVPVDVGSDGLAKPGTGNAIGFSVVSQVMCDSNQTYRPKDVVGVMTDGRLWVKSKGSVAIGDELQLDAATHSVTKSGAEFTKIKVTAKSAATGDGAVIVRIEGK